MTTTTTSFPANRILPGERTSCCATCRMLVPAERPVFHPHLYCMLINAGVQDPERYMALTMESLIAHFGAGVDA